jgi:hypothetical protein
MTPRVKRRPAFRGLRKTTATAVVAWGFIGISSALAQSGNLDMDVNPDAHVAGVPAASTPAASVPAAGTPATPAIAPEGAPAAVAPSGPITEQADAPVSPQPDSADSNSSVFAAPSPSTPEPVSLDHPTVINTAKHTSREPTGT